jgi:glycosyltransferase involved in cell wall biosynthesis
MRLVFFDCVTHFGGSNQSTLLTIREMQKRCEVIVLDAYGVCREYHDTMERFAIKNIVVQPNPKYSYVGGLTPLARIGRILAGSVEIAQLVKRLGKTLGDISPDAIWTNSHKGFCFLCWAVASRIPLVYFVRSESMYPHWYNKWSWHKLAMVAANSESGLSRLRHSPYERPVMEVIPNGIDVDETLRQASVKAADLPARNGLCILFPASLHEGKNQATCIKGFAQYLNNGGNASLWLAGDISPGAPVAYQQYLHDLIDELGVSDRVHFLGWRDDIPAVMADSDIVVLTSLSEGMPRVIIEAMSLSKPVIASTVGGIPEVVRDGIDGFLVAPRDSQAVADAIEKLAENHLREKMGRAGFERVKSCFDIKVTALRFLDVLSRIC